MKQVRFIDNFSVILLDMGNTFMFGCDRFGDGIDYHATYRNLGGHHLDSQTLTPIMNRLFKHVVRSYRNPALYDNFGSVGTYLRELPETSGLTSSELELLEEVFAQHEVGAVPDSHAAVLKDLSRTHPLGVVSNIWSHPGIFEAEFRRAGIMDLFQVIVWSSSHGCIKPSPRLFQKAMNQLDFAPHDIFFVGDNLNRDVAGAKAVGIKAVWINGGSHQLSPDDPQPERTISDLAELLTVL